jgi:D-arabinose 5-phosphate isomerase GutQ
MVIDANRIQEQMNQYFSSMLDNLQTACSANSDYKVYEPAVRLITQSEMAGGRLHLTGIGKPGHLSEYFASLFSSTGTPAYFLDGTEAVHGSSGQVRLGDVVIAISNSGNTSELLYTVRTLKDNGAKIIGVSGNAYSQLAKLSDVFLHAPVSEEGGPLNRAPRNSIMVEMCVLQGLSIALQGIRDITPRDYVRWHPGGALGKLRQDEK